MHENLGQANQRGSPSRASCWNRPFLFEQLKEATNTLENATQSLSAQNQSNKDIYDAISVNKKNYELLKTLTNTELKRINDTLDRLATELQKISQNTGQSNEDTKIDWSTLMDNVKRQITVPEVTWVIPKSYSDPNTILQPENFDWSKYNIDIKDFQGKNGSGAPFDPFRLEGQAYDSLKNLSETLDKQAQIPLN